MSPGSSRLTVAPEMLVFTPQTWFRAQEVSVCARVPKRDVAAFVSAVLHDLSSADPWYDAPSLAFLPRNASVRVGVRDEPAPPRLVTAVFDDNGAGAAASFDVDTDRAGMTGAFRCERLFNNTPRAPPPALGALGDAPACVWVDARTVRITFGASATVLPGDTLRVLDGRLRSSFAGASLVTTNASAPIDTPRSPVAPVAAISAPDVLGLCDTLVLDAALSSGSGGRALRYNWTLAAAAGSGLAAELGGRSQLTNLTHALAVANMRGDDAIAIPRLFLPAKVRYTFTLRVANFLSAATSAASVLVLKASMPAPHASIQGHDPKTTTRDARLRLVLSAEQPNLCAGLSLDERRMVIEWRELTGRFATDGGSLAAENPRVLTVPAFTLSLRATYRFEAFVYMQKDPSINATSRCSVYVAPQPLVAGLSGGATRVIGADIPLCLDASPSYDPDAARGSNATLAYAWSCANVSATPATPCVDASGALLQPALDAFATATVTLAAGTLSAHDGYEFSVRVSKDTLNATATVRIIVVPGAPPETGLSLGGLAPDAIVNPNEADNPAYVALVGEVSSTLRIATALWTLEDGAVDAASPFAVEPDRLTTALALQTMTVGVTYTFRLTVTDVSGSSAYGEVLVLVNAPPTSGACTLAPSSGLALVTDFAFRCVNWVDDDLPLYYEFRSQVHGEATRTPLADTQHDPSYVSQLPMGSPAHNYTVIGWADVIDAYAGTTQAKQEVLVLPYADDSSRRRLTSNAAARTDRDAGARVLLAREADMTDSELLALVNVSAALVAEAVDSRDSAACMQSVGGVAAVLNARNATIVSASGAAATVREVMIVILDECMAMTELTRPTVTQTAGTLARIARDGAELNEVAQLVLLAEIRSVTSSAARLAEGVDRAAAESVCAAISALFRAPRSLFGSASGGTGRRRLLGSGENRDWFALAANLTATTEALCSAALATSLFGGASSTIEQPLFSLACKRETYERSNGLALTLEASALKLPRNFSFDARLRAVGGTYADFRLAHFGINIFDVDGAPATLTNRTLNSGIVAASAYSYAGRAVEFTDKITRLDALKAPALITVSASSPYNLTVAERVLPSACGAGGGAQVVSIDCPLGTVQVPCDGSDDAPYSLVITCPHFVPLCLAWASDDSFGWRPPETVCRVANYTSFDVTCACDGVYEFVALATNVSAPLVRVVSTPNPTLVPSPAPTITPTVAPTYAPTTMPTPGPTTVGPSTAPSVAPTTPSPTPVPSTASPTESPSPFPTTSIPTSKPTYSPTYTPLEDDDYDWMLSANTLMVLSLAGNNSARDCGYYERQAFASAVSTSMEYVNTPSEIWVRRMRNYGGAAVVGATVSAVVPRNATANSTRRLGDANQTSENRILVNYTLELRLQMYWPSDDIEAFDDIVLEDMRSMVANATHFDDALALAAGKHNATALYGASMDVAATLREIERSWRPALVPYRARSPEERPLPFLDEAMIAALATSTSATVVAATAASTAVPAGDPLSLVFAVQFISLTSNIDGLPSSYTDGYAGSFAWANLQFPPPGSRRRRRRRRRRRLEEGAAEDDAFGDDDYEPPDANDARDLLYGNILSILYAVVGGGIGRRVCAVLIRWKKAFDAKVKEVQERIKRELEELEQRALDAAAERAKSAASSALANGDDEVKEEEDVMEGAPEEKEEPPAPKLGSEEVAEEDEEEEEEEEEEDMTVDDPYADTPLPFLPTAWQKNADNPSYELNMLLVSQMGLFVSCLSVFEWGNEIEPGVHALAVVVLLAILTGDWCFFVFLRRAMARLRAAGSLEWVHDDAVYDLDKEGHRVWYQHDEDGHVLRDRWRRKKRACMDVHVHPAEPTEFDVIVDKHHHAIYYEHYEDGMPICDNHGRLQEAMPDKSGHMPPNARPVPLNEANPQPQFAAHVAYHDKTFKDRLYLLAFYSGATTGTWTANDEEGEAFMKKFGSLFCKFGPFGAFYYFMELGRKILDVVVITHAKGGVQTGLASAIQWAFNFVFMFVMPYADMKSNHTEITQNLGRLQSMLFCAASSAGLLDPAFVGAVLIMVATVQIYCNIAMGMVSAVKKKRDYIVSLKRRIDLVSLLQLKRVPPSVAKRLVIVLHPPVVKLVTEQFVDKLIAMIVSIFGKLLGKIMKLFDEACEEAEQLLEAAGIDYEALQDPEERAAIICQKIATVITDALGVQVKGLVLPKAQALMDKINENMPSHPSVAGKVSKKLVTALQKREKGVRLPNPAVVLTNKLVRLINGKLESFVLTVASVMYKTGGGATGDIVEPKKTTGMWVTAPETFTGQIAESVTSFHTEVGALAQLAQELENSPNSYMDSPSPRTSEVSSHRAVALNGASLLCGTEEEEEDDDDIPIPTYGRTLHSSKLSEPRKPADTITDMMMMHLCASNVMSVSEPAPEFGTIAFDPLGRRVQPTKYEYDVESPRKGHAPCTATDTALLALDEERARVEAELAAQTAEAEARMESLRRTVRHVAQAARAANEETKAHLDAQEMHHDSRGARETPPVETVHVDAELVTEEEYGFPPGVIYRV